MPSWDADQYLKFGEERTRACRDLVARVAIASVKTAIDLGCGPGNSTQIIAERWPGAQVIGLDSSADMIGAARLRNPDGAWLVGDIAAWARDDGGRFDLVCSNAALQWVTGHAALYPRLLERVSHGGAFAAQIPHNFDSPAHRAARELAGSRAWRAELGDHRSPEYEVHDGAFYYDALAPLAARLDIWETTYFQIFPGPSGIVEWYRGTALRPYLDALDNDALRERFCADYLAAIRPSYPQRADGRVAFPFRRLFVIAYC